MPEDFHDRLPGWMIGSRQHPLPWPWWRAVYLVPVLDRQHDVVGRPTPTAASSTTWIDLIGDSSGPVGSFALLARTIAALAALPSRPEACSPDCGIPGTEPSKNRRRRRVILRGAQPLFKLWRTQMPSMPQVDRVANGGLIPSKPHAWPRRYATTTRRTLGFESDGGVISHIDRRAETKARTANSSASREWVADTCVRIRASPFGTTG
jgi:hypothetical protein